jgi:hypothetical protein
MSGYSCNTAATFCNSALSNEPPNINSARVEREADNNDIHVNTSSGIQQEEKLLHINQRTTFSQMMIRVIVKP